MSFFIAFTKDLKLVAYGSVYGVGTSDMKAGLVGMNASLSSVEYSIPDLSVCPVHDLKHESKANRCPKEDCVASEFEDDRFWNSWRNDCLWLASLATTLFNPRTSITIKLSVLLMR